jgi:predicted dehydrogenase
VECFTYYNRDPKNIRNILEYGGGALMDIGCYGVYIARLVFDEEPTRVLGLIEEDPEMRTDAVTLSGDYAEALAAADRAKELLWGAFGEIMLLDYFYYTALTVAALYEKGSADEQQGWRDLLRSRLGCPTC